nr:putative lipid-transfer protein DIR1 [Ipomoea batatas]GME19909.1 putative lipid-transfer protein DIR1 [Ipomoea batatas]
MEAPLKVFVGFLVIVCVIGAVSVEAAGPCGDSSPDNEAIKLLPCAAAAQDAKAAVSSSCCFQVKKFSQNPGCLCAVLFSDMAKSSGVKPEAGITIPKRCNFANRPIGYKCGREFHLIITFFFIHYISQLRPY